MKHFTAVIDCCTVDGAMMAHFDRESFVKFIIFLKEAACFLGREEAKVKVSFAISDKLLAEIRDEVAELHLDTGSNADPVVLQAYMRLEFTPWPLLGRIHVREYNPLEED